MQTNQFTLPLQNDHITLHLQTDHMKPHRQKELDGKIIMLPPFPPPPHTHTDTICMWLKQICGEVNLNVPVLDYSEDLQKQLLCIRFTSTNFFP